ncbi:MAG: polyprenol monophosphomannose synthase [Thermoflexales bacterium]
MLNPLIFIPTYNERENVGRLCADLQALPVARDILFLDDNSPDGTGDALDALAREHSNLSVIHRPGKLGIGSAHIDGIAWARAHGYTRLVTMDSDFTHAPDKILEFLAEADDVDVVVGSRYLRDNSLPGWTVWRRILTGLGHIATEFLLGMPYDATGAFRLYRLDRISQRVFERANADGYSFFFQSLYILHRSGARIKEIPISLPARTAGHSKMGFSEIARSLAHLGRVFVLRIVRPGDSIVRLMDDRSDIPPKRSD